VRKLSKVSMLSELLTIPEFVEFMTDYDPKFIVDIHILMNTLSTKQVEWHYNSWILDVRNVSPW